MTNGLRAHTWGLEPRRSSRVPLSGMTCRIASMLVSAVWWVQLGSIVLCAQATPPPARPAQAPVPAAAPAQTAADAAVREALQQYSAALESLDAEQVRKIHPSVDVEALKRAFREMRELKVTIDNVKVISTEGPIARVSCRVTQALTPKAGKRDTTAVTRVLRLRRQEAVWLIDGFER